MIAASCARAEPPEARSASSEVLSVAGIGRRRLGLIVPVLLRPLGFVVAATALFVMVARAFAPLANPTAPTACRDAHVTSLIVGAGLLSSLVYLAFTRGLDLPLPEGAFWPWMR